MPAVALCVLAGYAMLGFTTLQDGPARARWRLAAAGSLVLAAVLLAVKASSFAGLRSELRFIGSTHRDLRALLAAAPVRDGVRCGALTFPTYRLVPDVRWMLDAPAGRVRSRAEDPRPGAVAVYIAGDEKFERRFGRADGVSRATNKLPAGEPALRSGPFVVFVARRC